ncbi:MAG TPA: COX15/CtaA family protein [Chitinophagaceae bacterium]|nr:COX15/CtaA family protein [Chitinophagaceae bacterium]
MEDLLVNRRTKPVAFWLLAGVVMIMVQVLLGGITRLTGSGLSITQWDPVIGALPPLNHQDWIHAFNLYRQTPQFRLAHPDFTLGDFKSIFFWEYLHRLWARLIGVVFLVPFILFLIQKRFNKAMVRPMIILFLLGGLQGLIGWIMVESGLTGNRVRVDHIRLAVHFIMALLLLTYTLWFAMTLLVPGARRIHKPGLKGLLATILAVLTIQLTYGAFMAGLHAALDAPTWPDMNGHAVPAALFRTPSALTDDPLTVQFIHRGIAYLILGLVIAWSLKAKGIPRGPRFLPLAVVLLQALLGILTVMGSRIRIPIFLAVSHQFVAMLVLITMVWTWYLITGKAAVPVAGAG